MSDDTVSGQASQDGDVQTAQDAGQISPRGVPILPPKEEEGATTDGTASQQDNAAEKAKRISDKEWQKSQEKAKEGNDLRQKLESAGLKDPDDIEKVVTRLSKLEADNARKDWELDHPIVRNDKYKEDWERVNKEKRYVELTFDERWALINRERGVTRKELESSSGSSQPATSFGVSQAPSLDQETADMGKLMGYTEADYKKAGVL